MTYYLVVFETFDSIVTTDSPYTLKDVRMSQPYEFARDAEIAQNAYRMGRDTAISTCNDAIASETSGLRSTIDTQARIVRDNNSRIEFLENELALERTKTKDRETILHNVMGALALDIVLERTHQQRNAAMRHIVRLIKRILDNVGLPDDDIPF